MTARPYADLHALPPPSPSARPASAEGVRGRHLTAPATAPSQLARADIAIAATLGCGALGLFVATLCSVIYTEDAAEFSTAAAVLGVPHPPGYPLHTLLAGLFVRVIRVGGHRLPFELVLGGLWGADGALLASSAPPGNRPPGGGGGLSVGG